MSNENNGGARRALSAIARAAKGAATGGVAGAAVGVAREFAPEIIKTALIILLVLILLPILVFTAIPNVLFGFENASANDITDFTNKAYSLNAEYGVVDGYEETASEGIIASILALFTSGETSDESAYDAVEVTKTLDNMNEYWFVAITSVANKQDLNTMNGGTIENMTKTKIESSWELFSETIGEGDDVSIFKTLRIDVYDLTADELMDKLNFTEEQRNWARVLYSALAQEQRVGIADVDNRYGTDYGNIIFSDTSTDVVYYNQTDSRWGGLSYGKTGTIAKSGCGPTALAIAVASLTSNAVTPDEVAKWSADNGYYIEGVGNRHTLITDGGAHYGLAVTPLGLDARKIADALGRGSLVIAIMSKGHFTSGGHFIVLRGVTSEGEILVADPASLTRSNREWALSLIINEANRNAGAGGPFWEVEG